MIGLVPGIHVYPLGGTKGVDGRVKPGHDEGESSASHRSEFHPGALGGMADIFLGLLEGAFQRLGGRHVGDLIEMR